MEFRKFYAKINFEIPAHFFRKKRRERGNLSAKMDSRVRGNDGGEAAHFTRKLSLEFPRIFLQKRGECGGFVGKNGFPLSRE